MVVWAFPSSFYLQTEDNLYSYLKMIFMCYLNNIKRVWVCTTNNIKKVRKRTGNHLCIL